jgi:hypothetical protein
MNTLKYMFVYFYFINKVEIWRWLPWMFFTAEAKFLKRFLMKKVIKMQINSIYKLHIYP